MDHPRQGRGQVRHSGVRFFRPVTTGSALTAFPDVGSVAGYAYAALTWAVEQGLVSGVGADDGVRLTPRGYASRAQVAAILMLYCDRETA